MTTASQPQSKRIPRPTEEVLADLEKAGRTEVRERFNRLVKGACGAFFAPGEQILMQGSADEAAYKEFMQRTETNFLELLVIGTDVQVYTYTSLEGHPAKEIKG